MDDAARAGVEQEVRAALARGDANEAATVVVRAYGPEMYGYIVAVLGEETKASEAFSLFAEGVWRTLPGFAWGSSLRTWLYAVARHVSSTVRRNARRRAVREPAADPSFLEETEYVLRTATLTFLRTDKRTRLEQLRDSLPPEDRELLILRVDRNLSWQDLAKVVVDPPPDTEAALAREAARLRKRFQLVKERLRAAVAKDPTSG